MNAELGMQNENLKGEFGARTREVNMVPGGLKSRTKKFALEMINFSLARARRRVLPG